MFSFAQASPEQVGMPSQAVEAFVRSLLDTHACFHSILVIKNGAIVFDGQFSPMTSSEHHRLYSCSKSFTSIAIGLLQSEGKLSLSDTIASFFPEYPVQAMHPFLAQTTIVDCLRMTDCHDDTTYDMYKTQPDMDWVRTYFETPPTHKSGTIFQYNTSCATMLSAIVTRVTGLSLTDYLQPRLFAPMGMSAGISCVKTPCGYAWGGSGILASAQDLAKVAYLCMHEGAMEGEQILPRDYIRAAISSQVDNTLRNDDFEHQQGYGYQIWCLRNGGFALRGMGSQQAFCLPEEDLLVVLTGDTQASPKSSLNEIQAIWQHLLPVVQTKPLPQDAQALSSLRTLETSLTLLCTLGATKSPLEYKISGRTYVFPQNPMGISTMRFSFDGLCGKVWYQNDTGIHEIAFGMGHNLCQQLDEPHFYATQIGSPCGRTMRAFASAAWKREHQLHITTYVCDVCFGTMQMSCVFDADNLTIGMTHNAEWFFTAYSGFATGQIIDKNP